MDLYSRSLLFVLRHRVATMAFSLAILAATGVLFKVVPKGFIPAEDRDFIMVSTQTEQGIAWTALVERMMALGGIVQEHPAVDRFMVHASTSGMMMVVLKPRAERELSADEVIRDLRPQLNTVPGIRAMLVNPLPVNVGGRRSRSLYQLTLQSVDTPALYAAASQLERMMRDNPELTDVSSDLEMANP